VTRSEGVFFDASRLTDEPLAAYMASLRFVVGTTYDGENRLIPSTDGHFGTVEGEVL
jgi:hypothetical protein